jgi:integrase
MDIDTRIAQANGRLKASKIRVQIERFGDKLTLRATLPPKPGSDRPAPYQQRIALGISANPKGISLAEAEARKIRALLDSRSFDWKPYLIDRGAIPQTVGEWVEKFSQEFRETVEPVTWRTDYKYVLDSLDQSKPLTSALLLEAVGKTKAETRQRKRYCFTLQKLANFAGVEVDLSKLKGKYSPSTVEPRDLPDDRTITEWFYKISNPSWRWVYGMLATYGLRNHEVFLLDLEELSNQGYMVKVLKGKTGSRMVWPCYPEWVDQFDLRNLNFPDVDRKQSHEALGRRVTSQFSRYEVPFAPYDLRHCWAIRTMEFGLDISLAAQQMGHSIAVHNQTYHRWITADVHQRAFNSLMMRNDRPRPPQIDLT